MPSAISKVTVGGQESLPVDRALLWGMTNTQRLEKIGAEHAHSPVGQIHPVSFCEIVHNLLLSNFCDDCEQTVSPVGHFGQRGLFHAVYSTSIRSYALVP